MIDVFSNSRLFSNRVALFTVVLSVCMAIGSLGTFSLWSAAAFSDDDGARKGTRRVRPSARKAEKKTQVYWEPDFIVSLHSNYVFRGFSSNNNKVAPSAQFKLNFVNGAYFSFWISEIEEERFDAKEEINYDIGYVTAINSNIDIDLGVRYFQYPGSKIDSGYTELFATIEFQPNASHGVDIGAVYANDYAGSTDEYYYFSAKYTYEWKGLDVYVGAGWNHFEDQNGFRSFVYGDSYNTYLSQAAASPSVFTGIGAVINADSSSDYSDFYAGVSHQFNEFLTLGLEFTDTDLDTSACDDVCGDHAVVYLQWQF